MYTIDFLYSHLIYSYILFFSHIRFGPKFLNNKPPPFIITISIIVTVTQIVRTILLVSIGKIPSIYSHIKSREECLYIKLT